MIKKQTMFCCSTQFPVLFANICKIDNNFKHMTRIKPYLQLYLIIKTNKLFQCFVIKSCTHRHIPQKYNYYLYYGIYISSYVIIIIIQFK